MNSQHGKPVSIHTTHVLKKYVNPKLLDITWWFDTSYTKRINYKTVNVGESDKPYEHIFGLFGHQLNIPTFIKNNYYNTKTKINYNLPDENILLCLLSDDDAVTKELHMWNSLSKNNAIDKNKYNHYLYDLLKKNGDIFTNEQLDDYTSKVGEIQQEYEHEFGLGCVLMFKIIYSSNISNPTSEISKYYANSTYCGEMFEQFLKDALWCVNGKQYQDIVYHRCLDTAELRTLHKKHTIKCAEFISDLIKTTKNRKISLLSQHQPVQTYMILHYLINNDIMTQYEREVFTSRTKTLYRQISTSQVSHIQEIWKNPSFTDTLVCDVCDVTHGYFSHEYYLTTEFRTVCDTCSSKFFGSILIVNNRQCRECKKSFYSRNPKQTQWCLDNICSVLHASVTGINSMNRFNSYKKGLASIMRNKVFYIPGVSDLICQFAYGKSTT